MPAMPDANAQPIDLRQLVTEAEQLRAALSLFVSHGTAARVTLPRSLHDAAAALLVLPDQFRDAAELGEKDQPCRS